MQFDERVNIEDGRFFPRTGRESGIADFVQVQTEHALELLTPDLTHLSPGLAGELNRSLPTTLPGSAGFAGLPESVHIASLAVNLESPLQAPALIARISQAAQTLTLHPRLFQIVEKESRLAEALRRWCLSAFAAENSSRFQIQDERNEFMRMLTLHRVTNPAERTLVILSSSDLGLNLGRTAKSGIEPQEDCTECTKALSVLRDIFCKQFRWANDIQLKVDGKLSSPLAVKRLTSDPPAEVSISIHPSLLQLTSRQLCVLLRYGIEHMHRTDCFQSRNRNEAEVAAYVIQASGLFFDTEQSAALPEVLDVLGNAGWDVSGHKAYLECIERAKEDKEVQLIFSNENAGTEAAEAEPNAQTPSPEQKGRLEQRLGAILRAAEVSIGSGGSRRGSDTRIPGYVTSPLVTIIRRAKQPGAEEQYLEASAALEATSEEYKYKLKLWKYREEESNPWLKKALKERKKIIYDLAEPKRLQRVLERYPDLDGACAMAREQLKKASTKIKKLEQSKPAAQANELAKAKRRAARIRRIDERIETIQERLPELEARKSILLKAVVEAEKSGVEIGLAQEAIEWLLVKSAALSASYAGTQEQIEKLSETKEKLEKTRAEQDAAGRFEPQDAAEEAPKNTAKEAKRVARIQLIDERIHIIQERLSELETRKCSFLNALVEAEKSDVEKTGLTREGIERLLVKHAALAFPCAKAQEQIENLSAMKEKLKKRRTLESETTPLDIEAYFVARRKRIETRISAAREKLAWLESLQTHAGQGVAALFDIATERLAILNQELAAYHSTRDEVLSPLRTARVEAEAEHERSWSRLQPVSAESFSPHLFPSRFEEEILRAVRSGRTDGPRSTYFQRLMRDLPPGNRFSRIAAALGFAPRAFGQWDSNKVLDNILIQYAQGELPLYAYLTALEHNLSADEFQRVVARTILRVAAGETAADLAEEIPGPASEHMLSALSHKDTVKCSEALQTLLPAAPRRVREVIESPETAAFLAGAVQSLVELKGQDRMTQAIRRETFQRWGPLVAYAATKAGSAALLPRLDGLTDLIAGIVSEERAHLQAAMRRETPDMLALLLLNFAVMTRAHRQLPWLTESCLERCLTFSRNLLSPVPQASPDLCSALAFQGVVSGPSDKCEKLLAASIPGLQKLKGAKEVWYYRLMSLVPVVQNQQLLETAAQAVIRNRPDHNEISLAQSYERLLDSFPQDAALKKGLLDLIAEDSNEFERAVFGGPRAISARLVRFLPLSVLQEHLQDRSAEQVRSLLEILPGPLFARIAATQKSARHILYRQAYRIAPRGEEFVEDLDTGEIMDNCYYLLGVPIQAKPEVIKKSYRALAWCFHPDRLLGEEPCEKEESEALFKRIVDAYEILSDPEKRRKFDERRANSARLYPSSFWLTHIPQAGEEPWETEEPAEAPVER